MAAKTPRAARPRIIASGEGARPQSQQAAPMPRNMIAIIPGALQRSASQPAGRAQSPTSRDPRVQRPISSWKGRPHSASSASTMTKKKAVSMCM